MLHLITGTPGTGKSSMAVIHADKVETSNKVNIVKNRLYYNHNLPLIEKFRDDFSYYEYEVGVGYDMKQEIEILPDDYFDMFGMEEFPDDKRPEDYFMRSVRFNEICERINEREGIQGFKGLLPVRTIYSNIKALKIDNIRSLILDWREAPDGSIFIIDEVQNVAPYDDMRDRANPIVKDLTIHRHRGFDFYFITQNPSLLHPVISVLIGVHWHITKPFGWKPVVYQWGSVRTYPNTLINKINREKKFDLNVPDRIYKLYKSTTINTHEKRIPWKVLFVLVTFILCCVMLIYSQISDLQKSSLLNSKTADVTNKHVEDSFISSAPVPDPLKNMEAKQAQQHNEMEELNEQLRRIQLEAQIEDFKNQRKKMMTPYSVIAFNGKCTAYNIENMPIDMPFSECQDYATGEKLLLVNNQPVVNNSILTTNSSLQ